MSRVRTGSGDGIKPRSALSTQRSGATRLGFEE
jgi:hypothetical protein